MGFEHGKNAKRDVEIGDLLIIKEGLSAGIGEIEFGASQNGRDATMGSWA